MTANLNLTSVNLLAVLAAACVYWAAGWIWYLPKVFGDPWSGLTGKDRKPARRWVPVGLFGYFLNALVLAILVVGVRADTAVEGAFIGILVWLGFIVALELDNLVWEKIPFNLLLVRVGHHLIGLGLAGAILAVWH